VLAARSWSLSLTVLELVDGAYREIVTVRGQEAFVAERPFAVTVVSADLLR